jgi:hypothetical protein
MRVKKSPFEVVSSAKISQRDKFILLLLLCISSIIQNIGVLLAAKQLPDLIGLLPKLLEILEKSF